MNAPTRSFTALDATEARAASPVPLLIGLTGPSGSGKTFSALRLATGIQSVVGGEIFVVDTEQRRSLHYEKRFKFKHVPFTEPFSSLDYLAALRFCKERGAGVVVIDSCSHEHDGPGGLMEQHEVEVDRMAGTDYKKRDRVSILAWQKPKGKRRKLINAITSELDMPVIFCFRAKTGTKPVPGGQPIDMGFTSIGAAEWMFEMAWTGLMLPGSRGVPTWESEKVGERQSIKMVDQFEWLKDYGQLDEEVGRRCAEWARGTAPATADPATKWAHAFLGKIDQCRDIDALNALRDERATKLEELREKRPELHQQVSYALSQAATELDPMLRQFDAGDGPSDTDRGEANSATTTDEATATEIIAGIASQTVLDALDSFLLRRRTDIDTLPDDLQQRVTEAEAAKRAEWA